MATRPPEDLKPGVVLLHGFTGSAGSWAEEHRAPFERAGHAVVTPDLPGHGRRGLDRGDACTLDEAMDVVRAAIHRAGEEGPDKPWLLGYSMGGRIALHAVVQCSESIAGLVLESASPGLADAIDRETRRMSDAALAERLERDGLGPFVTFWESLALFATQRSADARRLDAQRAQRLASDPEGWAAALRGLGTGRLPSLWDSLEDVAVPTLVLVGQQDSKFVEIGARMSERVPGAEMTVIDGVGHNVHLEAPGPWSGAILDFIEARARPLS
ncbi:MAG: 2-succinyl-6-hydroxy-2,4-cyclohexadiene-1-carboxylate synthase [Gemmatimonadota bacterium]